VRGSPAAVMRRNNLLPRRRVSLRYRHPAVEESGDESGVIPESLPNSSAEAWFTLRRLSSSVTP